MGVPGAGLGVEQRKRLTIGVELVAKPRLLFADEPTSGLDGSSSYVIVQFLRKLAAAGQAVICVVHQPSASLYAEFDSLLLLKAGGRVSPPLALGADQADSSIKSDRLLRIDQGHARLLQRERGQPTTRRESS